MPMRVSDLSVEHRFVEANGIRFHCVQKGSGPLVVLLHGFPENWWSWRYQIDPLVKAGYRVLAPDLRGYNQTDKNGPYDIDTLAADVEALIHAVGEEQARIVSHDWGGAIGWHLASTRPHVVERLAVLNCPHPVQIRNALLTRPAQIRRSWYIFFFQLPFLPEWSLRRDDAALVRRSLRAMALDRTNFSDEEIAPFRDGIQLRGAASAMVGYYRALFRRALTDPRMASKYPVIDAPSMLIWAKDDRALGYDDLVPGTERYVRDLRIVPIDHCGHFVQAERPEYVNSVLLDFLREPVGRAAAAAAAAVR